MALLAVAALVATAVGQSSASNARPRQRTPGQVAIPSGIHKIRHVVIIMQENRSFDSYFGTYPGAAGIPGLGGHPGVVPCLPDPGEPCQRPWHDLHNLNHGGPHSVINSVADINHGRMNGFIVQSEKGHVPMFPKPDQEMGYHTSEEIPNYWTYARDFVLQDHMFEPVPSWSLPAHLYMMSLWSAHCTRHNAPRTCVNSPDHPGNPPGFGPHPTSKPPIYAWTDLTYLLFKHHIQWRYYIFKGIEPDCVSDTTLSCKPVTQGPTTQSIWNPLLFFDTVHNDRQTGNIQSLNRFFSAARNGRLPAVSWVVPNNRVSEHPPGLISPGQTYVTGLINTIMQGPEWSSTAIFLAWDDWSGFYDNAMPPRVDRNGYGLRVPALVISPYAKRGYVDHQTLSFDAYVKFIEDDFLGGLRLNPRTDGRPDPRPSVRESASKLGNLVNDFNFNQSPRAPEMLPVHPKTDLVTP